MEDMGMTDLQFKSWLRQIIRRLEEAEGEDSKEKTDIKAGGVIERPETRFAGVITSDNREQQRGRTCRRSPQNDDIIIWSGLQ